MQSTNPSPCSKLPIGTSPRFYRSRTVKDLETYRQPVFHVVTSVILVDIGHAPPDHPTLSSDLYGIYCEKAEVDDLPAPTVDLLLQFEPKIGDGKCDSFRPSVVFWRDEFWVPILDVGQFSDVLSAVLYRIEVLSPPRLDILAGY